MICHPRRCDVSSPGRGSRRRLPWLFAGLLLLSVGLSVPQTLAQPPAISGPLGWLLASSSDLGPARERRAQVTVMLHDATRPGDLIRWVADRRPSVQWQPGQDWAYVEGAAEDLGRAFAVAVHDYRGRRGQVFYASARQPSTPAPLAREVSEIGRILGYSPHHRAGPVILAQDVPGLGLTPAALQRTYDVSPLTATGITGAGQTIVFFEFDGYGQDDLDSYAETSGLPPLKPVLVGGQPRQPLLEAVMDLEVAHAIAPGARLVVVNALPTTQADGTYRSIADLMRTTDRQYPGAVWSLSIGWGCDRLLTAADLAPVRAALATAESDGTTAFDASGDRGGLECNGGGEGATPPRQSDIGLDAVASLPEMTDVGGTTLSTDATGRWLAEEAWGDFALSQGTSGGVSTLFPRPAWQNGVSTSRDSAHRLTPDVAAVADPFTGVKITFQGRLLAGGGTSQAAPIWAALTAMMNQWLLGHGGHAIGNLNPALYRIAAGAARPAYHDITLGGNAVDSAAPGYDLVTGLGTPDVNNLVRDLLDVQRQSR